MCEKSQGGDEEKNSVGLDAGFLDDVFEARGISLNARREIRDSHRHRIRAANCEKVADVGHYQNFLNLGMQLLDDRPWHILGGKHPDPVGGIYLGYPLFLQRSPFRIEARSL